MTALFTNAQFASYLHTTVDNSTTEVVERKAWGELMAATRLTVRPDPAPDDLFGWALELAAIFYNNPTSDANSSLDDYSFSSNRSRVGEILKAATAVYGSSAGPLYSFPAFDWHWETVPVADPLTS